MLLCHLILPFFMMISRWVGSPKGKDFFSEEQIFFPLTVDLILQGLHLSGNQTGSQKVVSLCRNAKKALQYTFRPDVDIVKPDRTLQFNETSHVRI